MRMPVTSLSLYTSSQLTAGCYGITAEKVGSSKLVWQFIMVKISVFKCLINHQSWHLWSHFGDMNLAKNSGILQLAKMEPLTEHLPYVLPADLPAFAQRSRDLEFVLMRQLDNRNPTKLNIAQGLGNCRIVHIALT